MKRTIQRSWKKMTAVCLTAAAVVACLFALRGNITQAADELAVYAVHVESTAAALRRDNLPQEAVQYIPALQAAAGDEEKELVIGTPEDIYNTLRWIYELLGQLLEYLRDGGDITAPPVTEPTTATTAASSISSSTVSSNASTSRPPPPTSETTEPTAAPTTTNTTTSTTTTTASSQSTPASKGTYYFTVYGFGHGVGMSQEGAREYGARGWAYDAIIKHYYPGVSIAGDANLPSRVTHDGVSYDLAEYLARIAYREIGRCGVVADEAIKAQMVCAYTVAKRRGFKTTHNDQALLSDADWNSSYAAQYRPGMLALAASVLGKYVAYNGAAAETLYSASCRGYTASAQYVWNSSVPAAYLAGGRESPETVAVSKPVFTTDQLRSMVNAYNAKNPGNAITLGGDASQWIKILAADPYGYVQSIQIGNRTFTGNNARMSVFGAANLRSHNFTFTFAAG